MNPRKPLWTILTFAALAMIPYLASPMERFRFIREGQFTRDITTAWNHPLARMFPVKEKPAPVVVIAKPASPGKAAPPKVFIPKYAGDVIDPPPVSIEGSPAYLGYFHAALDATRAGHGITRIVHIGDSPLCGDLISSGARARLQKEFGDAGPGWHLVSRPWEFYMHDRMSLKASGWRAVSPLLLTPGNKGDYGLAGVAFTGGAHASSTFSGWHKNPPAYSRLEVHYQTRPDGGSLEVIVDGIYIGDIATKAAERNVALKEFPLSDAAHEVTLRTNGDGEVTLFGVVMERDHPGVVYDSIGSLGATVHALTVPNVKEFVEGLRLRRPQLVIVGMGTNESGYENLTQAKYLADYKKVIEMIREAVPDASILIMAPMDRGTRGKEGDIVTMKAIPQLVAWQRQAAEENHVAFFNTYQAMGGDGTMARWYTGKPRLVNGDYTHPTLSGANRVGDWLVNALLENLN